MLAAAALRAQAAQLDGRDAAPLYQQARRLELDARALAEPTKDRPARRVAEWRPRS